MAGGLESGFCVAVYGFAPMKTFLDYNTKMIQALDRQERWDGMKLSRPS